MKDKIVAGIVWIALALGVVGFGISTTQLQAKSPQLGSFNPTGAGTYLLQSSISSTQNTITLTSFTEPGSGIPYTISYINTDIIYGTIAPSSGNSEFISASGITQNANGTATLTGVVRGESRTPGTGGCVASSTLAHAYPGQTQFILSNSPCFYSEYATLRNNQTFSGIDTFTISPIVNDANSTSTAQLASRQFVLNTAIQGAGTSTETSMGIVQLANAAQVGAGTASSTTGAPLVIPNKFATTTPGTLCTGGTLKCIVATVNGKITQAFYDLTQSFTFTGGLTSNATTSIAASGVSSDPLTLNGIAYKFPSAQGASSTILATNGSGILTWEGQSTGAVSTTSANFALPTSGSATGNASCVPPLVVAGGGFSNVSGVTTGAGNVTGVAVPISSFPSSASNWQVVVACQAGVSGCSSGNFKVYAICVNP